MLRMHDKDSNPSTFSSSTKRINDKVSQASLGEEKIDTNQLVEYNKQRKNNQRAEEITRNRVELGRISPFSLPVSTVQYLIQEQQEKERALREQQEKERELREQQERDTAEDFPFDELEAEDARELESQRLSADHSSGIQQLKVGFTM